MAITSARASWPSTGKPSSEDDQSVILRPKVAAGKTFNELRLAVSDEPEVASTGKNTSVAARTTDNRSCYDRRQASGRQKTTSGLRHARARSWYSK